MFGSANQLLATIALAVGTTYIINMGKIRYAWTTLVPMVFVGVTTIYAGITNITGIYIPQLEEPKHFTIGLINMILTIVIIVSVLIILKDSVPIWYRAWRSRNAIAVSSER
jgi:carbon starvation protein